MDRAWIAVWLNQCFLLLNDNTFNDSDTSELDNAVILRESRRLYIYNRQPQIAML